MTEPTCLMCGRVFRQPMAVTIGEETFHLGCVRRAIRENRLSVADPKAFDNL